MLSQRGLSLTLVGCSLDVHGTDFSKCWLPVGEMVQLAQPQVVVQILAVASPKPGLCQVLRAGSPPHNRTRSNRVDSWKDFVLLLLLSVWEEFWPWTLTEVCTLDAVSRTRPGSIWFCDPAHPGYALDT